MVQLTPRSRIDEFARAEYARHFDRSNQDPVKIVNFEAVRGLMDDGLLMFRGRVYRSPPVSYDDAIRLYEIADRMAKLAGLDNNEASAAVQLRAVAAVQGEAARYFWRLVRPIDWRRFVPRILLRNPFRDASPREVDDLLGFFWQRQMTSSVRHHGSVAAESRN